MTLSLNNILLLIYAAVNAAVFILYGIDKKIAVKSNDPNRRSRRKIMRISERTLITSAVFGIIGAALGMAFFHHKTRKPKFYIGIPLILAAEAAAAVYIFIKTNT